MARRNVYLDEFILQCVEAIHVCNEVANSFRQQAAQIRGQRYYGNTVNLLSAEEARRRVRSGEGLQGFQGYLIEPELAYGITAFSRFGNVGRERPSASARTVQPSSLRGSLR